MSHFSQLVGCVRLGYWAIIKGVRFRDTLPIVPVSPSPDFLTKLDMIGLGK
jgi:hypothetical protein